MLFVFLGSSEDCVSGRVESSSNAAGELEEAGSGGCRCGIGCNGCCGGRSYCLAFLDAGATAPSEAASAQ